MEYDCQISYNVFFYGTEKADSAFASANTELIMRYNETYLTDSIMEWNSIGPFGSRHWTLIHELAQQRADLIHASGDNAFPQNHDSPFCAMNQDISYSVDNDDNPNNDPPGLKRWFELNPHFCDKCVNAIKNIAW